MKLPTSYLKGKVRSSVRFMVVGFTGSFVQTWFFMLAMWLLNQPEKGSALFYVAFGIGFVLEMIPNYLFSNWYTFGTRPDWKNASGFIFARAINLVIQFTLLPFMLRLLPTWREDYLSLIVIFVAGIINYLILLLFFKKPKEKETAR